jgi:hypothetical protein
MTFLSHLKFSGVQFIDDVHLLGDSFEHLCFIDVGGEVDSILSCCSQIAISTSELDYIFVVHILHCFIN